MKNPIGGDQFWWSLLFQQQKSSESLESSRWWWRKSSTWLVCHWKIFKIRNSKRPDIRRLFSSVCSFFYCCFLNTNYHNNQDNGGYLSSMMLDNNSNNDDGYNNKQCNNFNRIQTISSASASTTFSTSSSWLFLLIFYIIIPNLCNQLIMDIMAYGTSTTIPTMVTNIRQGSIFVTATDAQESVVKCSEIKQCSRMLREATLSHNLSYDLSDEKIELICVKLNQAVQCFNNYRKMCIDDTYQHSKMTADFYDQMSEGPLGLTMELCNNPKFKQDYQTLGPCQKKYREEFDQCLTLNQGSSAQQQNGSNNNNSTLLEQFIEHCCTLHNYHNCIYDISLDKCGKDAAEFSLKILELFNRGYLRECAKYANLSHLCFRDRYSKSVAAPQYSPVISLLLSSIIISALWSAITTNTKHYYNCKFS